MIHLTVLAIGLELPKAMMKAWEARGVFLSMTHSPGEAIPLLRYGGFDLCILGKSISQESRAKLVWLLRHSLHSSVPVVSLTDEVERSGLFEEESTSAQRSDTSVQKLSEFVSEARTAADSATH